MNRLSLLRDWTVMFAVSPRVLATSSVSRRGASSGGLLRLALCLLAVVALLSGCSDDAANSGTADVVEGERRPNGNVATRLNPRRYVAEWLVDAEAVGREAGGIPFNYVEVVDDLEGIYLVQGPRHRALQTRSEVVFCAGIFAISPSCASTPRPRGVPDVLAIGLRVIKDWSPSSLYQLSTPTEFEQAAIEDPASWSTREGQHFDIPVRCFAAVQDSRAAAKGFEICFTDDEYELIASVDLQGDTLPDISLESYARALTEEDLWLPSQVRSDADVYDQLVYIFPSVPDIVDIDPNAVAEVDAIGQVIDG